MDEANARKAQAVEVLSEAQIYRDFREAFSANYFSTLFKQATGLNFADYVARVRIENTKNLVLNPNLRISEIAFEAGFQSLSLFNRSFQRVAGFSPKEYRTSNALISLGKRI